MDIFQLTRGDGTNNIFFVLVHTRKGLKFKATTVRWSSRTQSNIKVGKTLYFGPEEFSARYMKYMTEGWKLFNP